MLSTRHFPLCASLDPHISLTSTFRIHLSILVSALNLEEKPEGPGRSSEENKARAMDDKGGIQALLAAEQDAQHIVGNARSAKTQRLRQAKEEAERDVAAYRSQRDADFKRKQEASSGSQDSTVKRLEGDTDKKIESLKEEAKKVSNDVTQFLLNYVTSVRI